MKDTLVEVRNAVLLFFLQESVFTRDEHLALIEFTCENQDLKFAFVEKILEELVGLSMITKVQAGDSTFWVLNKHLKMYEQTISLNYATATAVAEAINEYCKKIKNTQHVCDASQIKERDIQKLILMLENEREK